VVIFAAAALVVLGMAIGGLAASARSRRRSTREAGPSARQLADLLGALPQAALVTDADARLIAHNDEASRLLKAFGDADGLPLALDAAVGRVIRSRSTETIETALPEQPERRLRVSVAALPAHGSAGEALLLFREAGDGSGRADVYRQLTGLLAHELRTPLTAIMGHVDILGSCRIDEEDLWRRSLGFVAGEVDRLARLVEDLLSLSRLDRMPLHLQAVNLRAAAEEALSAQYAAAERSGVLLVLQAPNELPRVQADVDRIRQVFINLLDNAIKYAPGCTVTLRLISEREAVRVEISDDGPGIPPDDLPHIFEPMYRGRQSAPGARGTGLGLTIVHTILDQHHAPIHVDSAPGQGTTFTFSLPIAR
jgi:signal transduction histidine kinase